jgi:hypothetical protein
MLGVQRTQAQLAVTVACWLWQQKQQYMGVLPTSGWVAWVPWLGAASPWQVGSGSRLEDAVARGAEEFGAGVKCTVGLGEAAVQAQWRRATCGQAGHLPSMVHVVRWQMLWLIKAAAQQ